MAEVTTEHVLRTDKPETVTVRSRRRRYLFDRPAAGRLLRAVALDGGLIPCKQHGMGVRIRFLDYGGVFFGRSTRTHCRPIMSAYLRTVFVLLCLSFNRKLRKDLEDRGML